MITRNNKIRFRKGEVTIKGFVRVTTLISNIRFYIIPINTLFLLCLQDINIIGIRFNNLRNVLV